MPSLCELVRSAAGIKTVASIDDLPEDMADTHKEGLMRELADQGFGFYFDTAPPDIKTYVCMTPYCAHLWAKEGHLPRRSVPMSYLDRLKALGRDNRATS